MKCLGYRPLSAVLAQHPVLRCKISVLPKIFWQADVRMKGYGCIMHAYNSDCVLTTEDQISVNRQHMMVHCMRCRSRK